MNAPHVVDRAPMASPAGGPLSAAEEDPAAVSLFRDEVMAARHRHAMGEILLHRPRAQWLSVAVALALAAALTCFLTFGEYTRKERVTGQLVLSHQTVKQYAPNVGTVRERMVSEGVAIRRGDPLFRIDVDRVIAGMVDAQGSIRRGIEARRVNLLNEHLLTRRVLSEEEAAIRRKFDSQREQLVQLDREIATQRQRLELNAENLERARKLAAQEIVSAVELQEKEQEHLNLRGQLDAARRVRTGLQNDVAASETDLRNAPLKARTQLSALERNVRELEQQAVDAESRRELVVVALTDGQVTGVLVDVGQQVTPTTPLLSVLPKGAAMEAQLYVPTRAIGFLQPGGVVALRYQAFPYQKFGQHRGHVKSISRTTFSPGELQLVGDAKEQFYRVLVALDQQRVIAYGQPMPLHDGMQLEADLRVETRKIYEWILEPLFTLGGRY
jgi:membrane fusion protein